MTKSFHNRVLDDTWFEASTSPEKVKEIITFIKKEGFYCLEEAVKKPFLEKLQNSVNGLIKIHGKRYFSLIHPQKGDDKLNLPFIDISESKDFNSLLTQLSNEISVTNIDNNEGFNILRVVTGDKTDNQSLKFHYDSTLITALIPIYIPEGLEHESGDLIVFPNSRKIRSSPILNILEKFFIQNRLFQNLLPYFLLNNKKRKVVKLEPGNIYLFSGLQTLHCNFAVNEEYVRATLLCFHGNPYPDSKLLNWIRQTRHNKEEKNIAL
jgi:hypothetical protein